MDHQRTAVWFLAGSGLLGIAAYSLHHKSTCRSKPSSFSEGSVALKEKGVGVNKEFFRQLKVILQICLPGVNSRASGIILIHTLFLFLRTYLSVVVARIDGLLVKNLISGNAKGFITGLIYWFSIAIPATFTNSMIKYLQSVLALNLRTNLIRYIHNMYFQNRIYYKACNLDSRLEGIDQLFTTDIQRFCDDLSSLYSNLGKPVLDIVIFNFQLARSIGVGGTIGLFVNYLITARILKAVTPAFGKIAAVEAKLEGDFRSNHTRIITNAEEIAFYHGADLEKSILNKTYLTLVKHVNETLRLRIGYNMFEDFVIKYSWSAVGLIIGSIPVFFPEFAGSRTKRNEAQIDIESNGHSPTAVSMKTGSRTQGFITNKRLMLSLADAGGRIMYSYKELAELAGHTSRVYRMLHVFQKLKNDEYEVSSKNVDYNINDCIEFENVPIVTPSGDTVLVDDLTFRIQEGEHLMVTGPNGSGKSSIMRVLSGLWPLFSGKILRPYAGLNHIMYIPQKPYFSSGSLLDQIIYPHSYKEYEESGYAESDLYDILELVHLSYIPTREGGLDVIKEWKDVFSGGEKQRMQIARVFYHSPRFVVLDEGTSAVSNDVEALMYQAAKEHDITIISISHRPALFKYHKYLLRVGEGKSGTEWNLEPIGNLPELIKSVEAEISLLEQKIKQAVDSKVRLAEINKELGY